MELADVLRKIEQANDEEINDIIEAVIHRYQICYPGWEVLFLSVPKCDGEERKKQADELSEMLNKYDRQTLEEQ